MLDTVTMSNHSITKIGRLLLVAVFVIVSLCGASQESWPLKSWNSQNGSNIQMLKQGKNVTLLLRAVKPKDLTGETIKKSVYVGKYLVHLYTNHAVVGVNTSNGELQLLLGQACDIYTVDENRLGFDLEAGDNGYALVIDNGNASPIVEPGKQLVRPEEVRLFYDKKNKTRRYDISKYVGEMKDFFKNLRKGSFAKAYKNRQEILTKANKAAYGIESDFYNPHNPYIQALYPIWQLADALLNCRTSDYSDLSIRPDYYTALSEVSEVVKKNQLISETNTFLGEDGYFTSVDEIWAIIEKALFELTFKDDTEDAYDRLLANITDNSYIRQASIAREKVAFNNVYHSNELSECERYLNKYQGVDDNHYAEIIKIRNELAYAKLDYTVAACKEYLEKYPDSYYTSMVKERLYKCAYHEMEQTAAACEKYIKDYPESPFLNEVRNNLYKFAYQELGNTLEEYDAYMAKYPKSPYNDAIMNRREELAYYQAVEMDDVELYTKFLEDYPFSIYTDDVMSRKKRLISEAAVEEYVEYDAETEYDSNEYWDDYDEVAVEGVPTTSKKRTTGTRRRTKTMKKGTKTKSAIGTKQTKPKTSTSKDASKKANSLIFGPEN